MRKAVYAIIACIALLGATQLMAEDWAGTGSGSWIRPDGSTLVYPWQAWSGTLEAGTFTGTWSDDLGNAGGFSGSIIYYYTSVDPGDTYGHCEGSWNIYDPTGVTIGGPFEMEFNLTQGTCEGVWVPKNGTGKGTMAGERID